VSVTSRDVHGWIERYAAVVAENREYLTKLDQAIGDGDHGTNMNRGMQAALGKVGGLDDADPGTLLKTVGMALISTVGGAGGPLYGTLFLQMGTAVTGKAELEAADWAAALDAAVNGVQARGKAEPGDKTMVDALLPARDALTAALGEGASLDDALRRSADAAEEGMKQTTPMVARKGRASYLGERSAGHQDPGATSSYLLLRAAVDSLGGPAGSQ
jgi:phosphoenolpyruvate---glycerone phosphotransferase subunit DhaL